MSRVYTKTDLTGFQPAYPFFVGIDSDGCVFPTMELKQKECFHPLIIAQWGLEKIGRQVRACAEFVNLHSVWRGNNRFLALLKTFDLLRAYPGVRASGVSIPAFVSLRRWVESGSVLGQAELDGAARQTGDPELAAVLKWSRDINAAVAARVRNVAPFPSVRESLERIRCTADAICVSQTPTEALVREWDEHDLTRFIRVIAGQELGTKAEHIALAARGRYAPARILMIGDALGDRKAAQENGALFYPIRPGREEASWREFLAEAYDRFLAGRFAGAYQDRLNADFDALLPERPPWEPAA